MRFVLIALALLLSACNLVASDSITPLPPPDIPRVEFLFPQNDTTVVEGSDVQVRLVARDSGAGVARVELTVDDVPHQTGTPIENAAVPVFTVDMNWLASGVGLHSMSAIAYRADGTASDPVTIRLLVVTETDAAPETTPDA